MTPTLSEIRVLVQSLHALHSATFGGSVQEVGEYLSVLTEGLLDKSEWVVNMLLRFEWMTFQGAMCSTVGQLVMIRTALLNELQTWDLILSIKGG